MADTTIVFYGMRIEISVDELDILESRKHPLQIVAKKVGLESYWGNFAAPNEKYLLFVGKLLGKLGFEDLKEIQIHEEKLAKIAKEVSAKLIDAGISHTAFLYLEHQPDQ